MKLEETADQKEEPIGIVRDTDSLTIELFTHCTHIVYHCSLCLEFYRHEPCHVSESWAICDSCWEKLCNEPELPHITLQKGMYKS